MTHRIRGSGDIVGRNPLREPESSRRPQARDDVFEVEPEETGLGGAAHDMRHDVEGPRVEIRSRTRDLAPIRRVPWSVYWRHRDTAGMWIEMDVRVRSAEKNRHDGWRARCAGPRRTEEEQARGDHGCAEWIIPQGSRMTKGAISRPTEATRRKGRRFAGGGVVMAPFYAAALTQSPGQSPGSCFETLVAIQRACASRARRSTSDHVSARGSSSPMFVEFANTIVGWPSPRSARTFAGESSR